MMREHGSGLQCPSCRSLATASKLIFSEGFRCPGCGIRLQVSPAYTRALLLISCVIGILLVWLAGVRGVVHFCLFWTPTAFVVLSVVVRIAPHLLRPILIRRQQSHVTTLGLGNGEENRRIER